MQAGTLNCDSGNGQMKTSLLRTNGQLRAPGAIPLMILLALTVSVSRSWAQRPLRLVERREVRGTVQSVRPGMIELQTEDGDVLSCRIQDDPEKGVALRGAVIRFPADVHVSGILSKDALRPGMLTEFKGQVNRAGSTSGTVDLITVVEAADHPLRWEPAKGSTDVQEFVPHRICARLHSFRRKRLIVEVPPESPLRKNRVSFTVSNSLSILHYSRNYQAATPGDSIRFARLARFDTGDWVIEKLNIDLAIGRPAKEDIESRFVHLSNQPGSPREIRSAHFLLHTDASDRQGKMLLDKLETMYRLVSRYFGRRPGNPIECYVVHDLNRWPPKIFPAAALKKISEPSGITISRRLGNRSQSVVYACDKHSIVQHEAVHAFCAQAFGSTGPTWYAEGMAEMGNYWKENQQGVNIPPAVITYLQNTSPKPLLQIVQTNQITGDSWQAYAWRWALCYMLANNANYADDFRDLGIGLMLGRPGVSFENTYGQVADQVSFEYDFFVRRVDNGYRVDLCDWDWKRPFKAIPRGQRRSFKVEAGRGWQATGVKLSAGESYDFVSRGEWKVAAEESVTADGLPDGRGRLLGALMIRTQLGTPFVLGQQGEFTPASNGNLYVRCQDHWNRLDDNGGEITLHLRKSPESEG